VANVLILSLFFPPDSVSTAQLFGELAVDFKAKGHDVSVLTTTPHYSAAAAAIGRGFERAGPFSLLRKSSFEGIPVTHVPMPLKAGGIANRLLAWAWFHVAVVVAGLARRRPDVVIVPSPLLSLAVAGWMIGRGAALIYNVQELYPDLAINAGKVKNGALRDLLRGLERFVYEKSAAVTVIGPAMFDRVKERTSRPDKVRLVPNFVDLDEMRPLPRDNAFAREHGMTDVFSIVYAGNLGLAQGFDDVLHAADLLRDEPRMRFVFVGDGVLAPALRATVEEREMRNVAFVGHQPYGRVPEIYSASDACLVPLSAAAAFEAIPSKVVRIMACARPVVAIAPATSDLANIVAESGCGVTVEPGDGPALARELKKLASDPKAAAAMGARGREYAAANFSRAAVSSAYDALIREVA
jgi:colanic acid biosynthesis glycosyl transferase WcaI